MSKRKKGALRGHSRIISLLRKIALCHGLLAKTVQITLLAWIGKQSVAHVQFVKMATYFCLVP
jgi:hypothetical protein